MNYQAGRRLGVNVYLIDGGSEFLAIDIGDQETVDEIVELIRQMDFNLSRCRMVIATMPTPITFRVCWCEDADTVRFVYRLLREEGLFLGSTSGINVAAAVRVALEFRTRTHHRHSPMRRRREISVATFQPGMVGTEGSGGARRPDGGAAACFAG